MGELRENMGITNKDLIVYWSKFKIEAKGKVLEKAKNSYIEFCKMLNEVDFELVSDYTGNQENVELVYKLDDNVRINMRPDSFKLYTYKRIVTFKNNLKQNGDKFIKFIGLTIGSILIAKIKTFDGGVIDIDISRYYSFVIARQDFYDKIKEIGGCTTDYYTNRKTKINICIDDIKLNPINPDNFKTQTCNRIINFKNKLKENGDEFVRFVGLTNGGKLIAKIKTFDGGNIDIDIANYKRWTKSRQKTYDYCEEKGYRILSPYVNGQEKFLIDFNCEHKPHWITPNDLKQNYGCPICKESKGEKAIRLYLEKNNIYFKQEYIFEDCKYKRVLPFDFYISNYNLCIEFDGRQHFESNEYFGGEERLKTTQKRDRIKDDYCMENSINLLRISYYDIDDIDGILDEEFKRLREGFVKDNIA